VRGLSGGMRVKNCWLKGYRSRVAQRRYNEFVNGIKGGSEVKVEVMVTCASQAIVQHAPKITKAPVPLNVTSFSYLLLK
jgi:hypothetical protein